jgi:hypothetical protein
MEARWVKSFRCGGLTGTLLTVIVFSLGRGNLSNRLKQPVVDQGISAFRLTVVQSLLQRIELKVCQHALLCRQPTIRRA